MGQKTILLIIPLILSIGITPAISFGEMIDSPRKQMQKGVTAVDVVCKSGLTLMIRTSGDAVCVKPSTAERLVIAGFGTIEKTMMKETKHEVTSPNLVFILTDNQAQAILGVYGNMDVKTPNIDRLASDGILFNNVFAASGMCSPTRATLMTGLLPSQHGVHNWLDDYNLEDWPENWSAVEEISQI